MNDAVEKKRAREEIMARREQVTGAGTAVNQQQTLAPVVNNMTFKSRGSDSVPSVHGPISLLKDQSPAHVALTSCREMCLWCRGSAGRQGLSCSDRWQGVEGEYKERTEDHEEKREERHKDGKARE